MKEELIKESLSIKYLEILANYAGYTTDWPGKDFGRDLTINEISQRNQDGKPRFIETGRSLKIQAKATTESRIFESSEISFKYDLESKTFNDLIFRNNMHNKPLILFIFILPNDKKNWLKLNDESLLIKKTGYWFVPNSNEVETKNSGSKRITINKANKFTTETFNQLMEIYS